MKGKNKTKGIVFDLGGVLIENFGEVFIENTSKELKAPLAKVKKIIQQEEADLEKGKEKSLEFWKRVCKKLKIQCPNNRVLEGLWIKFYAFKRFAVPNKKMIGLVRKLRKNHKVAILSNIVEQHCQIIRKGNLFDDFDAALMSNEIGFRKPERQFFQEASRRLGIPFANLIFIDDQLRWVKAARKVGIKSILFKSAEQLEKKLKRIGVYF